MRTPATAPRNARESTKQLIGCPFCGKITVVPLGGVDSLGKNYALLDVIDVRKTVGFDLHTLLR